MNNDLRSIQTLWSAAVDAARDHQAKALVGGVNLRLDVPKLLKAAYATVKYIGATGKAAASGFVNPLDWLELGASGLAVITAGLDALRQDLGILGYVVCMALADHDAGLHKADLKARVSKLLALARTEGMPWYLGFSRERIDSAEQEFSEPDALDMTLADLQRKGLVRIGKNDLVTFTPLHFSWTMRRE